LSRARAACFFNVHGARLKRIVERKRESENKVAVATVSWLRIIRITSGETQDDLL
jgi:hypothetical protein